VVLTEFSLSGVRLPCSRRSLSFYSLPCQAGAAIAASKQTKEKNKSMFTDKEKTKTQNQGAVKSTCPSNADIATRAYEIWLASGKAPGNDQQNWFEAKRQLKSA
jgi:hypothetical protein